MKAIRIFFSCKLDAIKLRMQRLGMLKEKVEVSAPVETYEQIRERLGINKLPLKEAMDEYFINLARRWKEEKAKKEESERVNLNM